MVLSRSLAELSDEASIGPIDALLGGGNDGSGKVDRCVSRPARRAAKRCQVLPVLSSDAHNPHEFGRSFQKLDEATCALRSSDRLYFGKTRHFRMDSDAIVFPTICGRVVQSDNRAIEM
jgi:hypothetical protein